VLREQITSRKRKYNPNLTTIALSKTRYKELREFGRTAESFDTVVGRLLDEIHNKRKGIVGNDNNNKILSQ
jgi:hypothetical protein